jgi:hypothetical protein
LLLAEMAAGCSSDKSNGVAMELEEGEGSEALLRGTALDHFAESEELLSLVRSLPQVYHELRSREKSEERFTSKTAELVCIHNVHVPGF